MPLDAELAKLRNRILDWLDTTSTFRPTKETVEEGQSILKEMADRVARVKSSYQADRVVREEG